MAQIFDRSSNALARMSLVLTGLIVIALGVTLDQLQRSPWVTRQGQRADQPVPFSHKHHVQGLGMQCQYCHTSVEKSSYAGIPPTKTCMNCHAQIWTNADLLEPVRTSWATGESIPWTKVHDLPDFVYFSHEIHVNKGIGCSSCHGRVDRDADYVPAEHAADGVVPELPSQSWQESSPHKRDLQHGVEGSERPEPGMVRASSRPSKEGTPTAQDVTCTQTNPSPVRRGQVASLHMLPVGLHGQAASDAAACAVPAVLNYQKFTSQDEMGKFLEGQYHIRTPRELSSCEVCHR